MNSLFFATYGQSRPIGTPSKTKANKAMQLINGLHFNNIRGDVFGGLTAAVVALPLALAFGVASGAGGIAGLYGGIFVGFIASIFGGTPAQVSGPTGPMTVVMTAIIMEYAHDPAMAFTVVVMGGLLQILFGVLRLGRYVTYVPFPVISGFMSGIGCIIIIMQLAPFFGHPASQDGIFAAIAAIPVVVSTAGGHALTIGVASLGIMILMPQRLRAWAPPPLVALIVGSLISLYVFTDVPVIGEIPSGLPVPHLPVFELSALPDMLRSSLILAVLGAIDSLLTSLVADSVTRTQHRSDRELIGQGIGNMVAGLMGGIPGAGATMRTVVNARAGGRTPISGALHALVLLSLVLGLAPLAEGIPHAVLAGILLKVGWDIIDWNYLKRLHSAERDGAIVMFAVLVLTVLVDLITAVGIGIIMKSLLSASRLGQHELGQLAFVDSEDAIKPLNDPEREEWRRAGGHVLLLHLSGPFSFASAKDLLRRLANTSGYRVVVLNFADVRMIDTSIAMAIDEFLTLAAENGQEVIFTGLSGTAGRTLERMRVLANVPESHKHATRLEGLSHAAQLVAGSSD